MRPAWLLLPLVVAACSSPRGDWERALRKEQDALDGERLAVEREMARIEARELAEAQAVAQGEPVPADGAAPRPAAATGHESEALAAMKASMEAAKAHDLEGAKRLAEHAVELRPGFVDPLMMLAAIAEQDGAYEEARGRYREVLRYDPTDVAAGNALGYTYLAEGRFDQAREWFLKVIDADPGFEAAAYNLGSVAEQKEELETAATWFDVSASLDRRDPRALVHLADIRLAQARPADALAAADAAIQRAPSFQRAQAVRARALAALGRN